MRAFRKVAVILACLGVIGLRLAGAAEFRYLRVGNPADATGVTPKAGFALMGGGDDLDEAFQWLCARGGGGDFLILRATNNDEYNGYVQKLCGVNSVATLVLSSRAAATDPQAGKIISRASALFISGGDQANYINYWTGTPVQAALNEAIRRGVPIGGTSAGLAVLGEWAYSAQGDKPDDPNLDSKTALQNAFHPRITLVHGFLDIPILKGVITDSHFAKRDRMGRLLVFVARLNEPDGKPHPLARGSGARGIGVDERSAILLEPDGAAKVIGPGRGAYFVDRIDNASSSGAATHRFQIAGVTVHKVGPGHEFNLRTWRGVSTTYILSVSEDKVRSTQTGGAIY
jgi:cyanophycinase